MSTQNMIEYEAMKNKLNFLDRMVDTLLEAIEGHEKVLHEQAKQIEELTRQMNELLEKA